MGKRSREKWERRLEGGSQGKTVAARFQTDLEKVCLFVITWGTYLVLFAPLIVIKESFFPFVTPKTIFFNALVEILLVTYLFLAISVPKYRPKINFLTIALAAFLGVLVITSITGINFSRSFWSTHERMTGLFTMFHLFAFFLILTSVFKRLEDWKRVLGVSVIVGVLLSLYVLSGQEVSTRGGGTIGNTSFMAAYLLFNVFFALILLLSSRSLIWRIFSGGSFAIITWVLLTSTARGAMAAFFLGVFLLATLFFIFSRIKTLRMVGWSFVLVSLILGAILIFAPPDFIKEKIDILFQEMNPRFVVWNIALKAWQEKPLLGWGPENFPVPFGKYFNPCLFLSECGGEIWFDRAHNIIFDTAVSSGILGIISYLTIFVVAIGGLLKIAKKVGDLRNLFLPLGMGVLLVVYFFQNLLVFDMINSYLVFFLSLGFASFLAFSDGQKEETQRATHPIPLHLMVAIIIVFSLLFWFGNVHQAISGLAIVRMVHPQVSLRESMEQFKRATSVFMEKYEAREHFARRVSQFIADNKENRDELKEAIALAEEEFAKGAKENPLDLRTHLFLGKLYSDSFRFSGNIEELRLARKTLERALELGPTNQQSYWFLGEVRLAEGRNEEAIELFKKAVELEPRFGSAHWFLAMAYKIVGNNEMAAQEIDKAVSVEYPYQWQNQDISRAVQIYQAVGDDKGLAALLEKILSSKPRSSQLWALLAATYANLGQFDKAKEAAVKSAEIDPSLAPKVQEFINSLPR